MSEHDGRQVTTVQRPTTNDREAWKAYWKAQGQPWRTEPEPARERQKYLVQHRSISPDIKQGIYPFKDVKLSRADIEWLLATHKSGGMQGPVDWSNEQQRKRQGLDVRGANLSQEDLTYLPLACMQGGLHWDEWFKVTDEQRNMAAVCMEKANLGGAQLQGANLWRAQLQGANLMGAQLQGADLGEAQLQKANLREAQLQKTYLSGAQLQGAHLGGAQLQKANLREAQLQGANLMGAQLQKANLREAQLQKANLMGAQLQGAHLMGAQLQGAHLGYAQLQGANLHRTDLEHAALDQVTFGDQTYGAARFADINWGNVNLAVVDWGHVKELGDEQVAHQKKDSQGRTKDKQTRVHEYKEAVRAYRQLSVVLRNQGLNEDAARFAYRAQKLQRIVSRLESNFGQYLFSLFLDFLAGYGYRPLRSVIIYLLVIAGFAIGYYEVTHILHAQPYPLAWYEALILSVSSFHGRGFFQPVQSLGDPVAILASIEAVFGLLIEISFIATFTQRFFGK